MKTNYSSWSILLLSVGLTFGQLSAQEAVKGEIRNTQFHTAYTPSFQKDGTDAPIKNVILMIGDGMGLAHLSAGMYSNHGQLTITSLKTCGLVRTQSANNFITDSAASGTAYATGQKTNNGTIGLDTIGNALINMPEKLDKIGYISGIVTTDNLDGATPAAFFAHQQNRNMGKEIWKDISQSKLTFFAAGSKELFKKQPQSTQKAIEKQFTILNTPDIKILKQSKKAGYLPEQSKTASINKNRGNFLPATTQMAIDYLNDKQAKGFFLMVEGARIDKSAHDNDFQAVVREVLDFDQAVEAAIRFAEKDGHTLVIITADHETGALSLGNGNMATGNLKGTFVSKGHSPIMVPLFVYGPQSHYFSGVQENNDIHNKIYQLLSKSKNSN